MKLFVPCDWIEVDLLTTPDANMFGEALRGYCFVGNASDRGCYSTFEVLKCFKKVTEGKIYEEAKKHLWEDIEPTIYHFKLEEKECYLNFWCNGKEESSKVCEPYEIVMGYTWEGDGCLYFRLNNRSVVNTDCKKSYGWEWINA